MANKLYLVVLLVALVVPQSCMARKVPTHHHDQTKALAPTSTNNVVVHEAANAPSPKNGVVDKKCIVGGWAGMGGFVGGVMPVLGGVGVGGVGAGGGVGGVVPLGGVIPVGGAGGAAGGGAGAGAGGLGGVGGVGGVGGIGGGIIKH